MSSETNQDPKQAGLLELLEGPALIVGAYLLGKSIAYGSLGGVRQKIGHAVVIAGAVWGAWRLVKAVRLLLAR